MQHVLPENLLCTRHLPSAGSTAAGQKRQFPFFIEQEIDKHIPKLTSDSNKQESSICLDTDLRTQCHAMFS